MPTQTFSLEGKFRQEQEKTYVYLPFEMPGQATQVLVRLDYDNRIGSNPLLTGGNTIDLGIFDARGIDFLKAGFRGWSGSERLTFFIGETEATPGYLAGALIPGQWRLFLGLYKIAPEGCSYHATIEIATAADHRPASRVPGPGAMLPASAPRAPTAPWVRGELHCHTWHSDGDTSPADLVRLAHARGLDFLAVTDHNTISSQGDLATLSDPGLVLLRGVEVTTFKGHFNVWGIGDWVDFRVQNPSDMAAALAFAQERGGLTCCNHPKPYGPPWDYAEVTNYDCIEVWNGPWTLLNEMALEFWKEQLASGRRLPAVGGSDWHRQRELAEVSPRAPGTPTTWVHTEGAPGASTILNAIRQGHVSLSSEPEGPFLDLRAGDDFAAMSGDALRRPDHGRLTVRVHCLRGQGYHIHLLDQTGVLHSQVISEQDEWITAELAVADSLFVRAELRTTDDEMKALTNPIYLESAYSRMKDEG